MTIKKVNKSFVIVFSLLFLLGVTPITVKSAVSYKTITIPADSIFQQPNHNSLSLKSGQFAYVICTATSSNNLHIYLYTADGELEAYTVGDVPLVSGTPNKNAFALYDNETSLVIMGLHHTGGSNSALKWAIKYDLTSYAITDLGYDSTVATTSPSIYVSDIFFYNDVLYQIVMHTATSRTFLSKLDIVTGSLTDTQLTSSCLFTGSIFGFQDSENPEDIYLMGAKTGDTSRPLYVKMDLEAEDYEVLANHPTDTHIRGDSYISTRYISGGIEYDETENQTVLYHTWVWSDDASYIETNQHRLIFNGTNIISAELNKQNFRTGAFDLSSKFIAETAISGGYMEEKDKFYFYHIDEEGTYPNEEKVSYRREITIDDWFNYDKSYTTYQDYAKVEQDIRYGQPYHVSNIAYKDMSKTVMAVQKYDDSVVWIYFGLLVAQRIWTISIDYIPSGDLETATQYKFTITLYLNDIAYAGGTLIIKMDNSTIGTLKTDVDGQIDFPYLFSYAGVHELIHEVYVSGELDETIEETLTVYTTEKEEEGVISDTLLYTLSVVIPILFVVLLPAFLLASILKSVVGFLIGLVLGGVMGTTSGILHVSALFLIVLLVAVYIIFVIRRG